MQLYLKQVLEAFFHSQSSVRHFALSVIALTLNQGLIHPVQVLLTWSKWLHLSSKLSSINMNSDGTFCAVCTLPHCYGYRPRAQHEEQSWPAACGNWQEIHRIHPCESQHHIMELSGWICYIFMNGKRLLISVGNGFFSLFCRWRRLLGWRCRTVCSRPSICLERPS